MTVRQLGEIAIRIFGVYYAASAVVAAAATLGALVGPSDGGLRNQFAAVSVASSVAMMIVAACCLLRAERIARRFFPEAAIAVAPDLPRRDWLLVAISLVGMVWILLGIPTIVRTAGRVIWFAEASRQMMLGEILRQSAEALINAVLSVLPGIAVVAFARPLADRMNARL